jgi:hypothetical protein
MGHIFATTSSQMNNWGWDNPGAFMDEVASFYPPKTISGKAKPHGDSFYLSGCDYPRAKSEESCCQQYKPSDVLAIKPLNWDEIIDDND